MNRWRIVIFLELCLLFFAGVASANEPLVFVFQKQKNPAEIKQAADKVAEFLERELALPVKAQVPSDYSASVQALVSGKADVAYVSSLPFLLARRDGGASLLLVEERKDLAGKARTEYDSVFIAHKDSPLNNMDDLARNAASLRMVFTSPTSTSGYVMANHRLVKQGLLDPKQDPKLVFKSVAFGGSYTQALEQVLHGRGDVAAVSYYAVEGPSASKYLPAEKLSQLKVISRTSGVPTHLIAVRGGMPLELKNQIKAALLKLSASQPKLLQDVYGAARFVESAEDAHLEKTIEAVKFLDAPIEGIVHKTVKKVK